MNKEKRTARARLTRLCFAAMFAALIFAATKLIQVPTPTGGYVHFGDCFILIAAWTLGPVYGFAAAGIGSALVDLMGYAQYVPGTFFVKGLMAMTAALIMRAFPKREGRTRALGFAAGGLAAEVIMICGYYLYEALPLGYGFAGALEGVFGNALQGAFGLCVGTVLMRMIEKTGVMKNFRAHVL
ncbi:MAG: ECF transporter S component [Lachnospiraceae bacterium]|nr:ECF transporter S component [Ruminococcus sp.]MCM1274732.1 ECF transporter S component [Lachnospiraceae bacterium]